MPSVFNEYEVIKEAQWKLFSQHIKSVFRLPENDYIKWTHNPPTDNKLQLFSKEDLGRCVK